MKNKYEVNKYEVNKYEMNKYEVNKYEVQRYQLLTYSPQTVDLLINDNKCDKYDYIIAVTCGVIGGLIDIFLVGTPGDSVLGKWTDKQVDNAVMSFAKKMGWNPSGKNATNAKSAIGFLEHGRGNGVAGQFQGFKVNYDQRVPGDVNGRFNIAPQTHHMMSLAHSPDIVGLFFSVLNQFTSTSTFIADGKLVTIDTETFELKGGNFVAKIICGIVNWLGHLMSDIAGSSGAHGRGTGIVVPFYEFFGFCKKGSFSTAKGKADLAQIAQQAFTQGYDARFGLAMAIPVLVTDLLIRVIWSIRRFFQYKKPLKECIPLESKHSELRVMLIFGQGTLCVFDVVDAGIESGGNAVMFFMRLNLVAWFRFVSLIFKEICIRVRVSDVNQIRAKAYNCIQDAMFDKNMIKQDNADFECEKSKNDQLLREVNAAKKSEDLENVIMKFESCYI